MAKVNPFVKKQAPGDFGAPPEVGTPAPKPKSNLSARNNTQETPDEEEEFHQEGGKPAPTPESVNFKGEDESCANCEYNQDGQCSFLDIPIGLTCNRFEAKSEDQGDTGQQQLGLGGAEEAGETA